MKKEELLRIIKETANNISQSYGEENEIHEDYYVRGVRRLEEALREKILKNLSLTKYMREIKFRAWDKKSKKMFTGVSMLSAWNNKIKGFDMEYGDVVCMQFTGLKDKNGKEIYEGDIVKNDDKYYPINPVIYYADIINEHDGDWDEWYCGFCLDDVDHTPLSSNTEIIGNIYENPNLL